MSARARPAAALLVLLALGLPAVAHADPRYRSVIGSVRPAQPGLALEVLGFDQNLQLVNRTGEDVLIRGYDDEPYARVLADGTVQVNRNSPATYLNEDRFGVSKPPASAGADRPVAWRTLNRSGRFVWHDHRMHWMSASTPPAVTDEGARTRIFDYAIPLEVGGRRTTVRGTLWWVGLPGGGMPAGAAVALGALALAALALVALLRRRRRATPAGGTLAP